MKLQILVPQYKETEDIIKPLLDSIAIQQNVDFNEVGVIIVNDGSDVHLSKEFLDGYPFQIRYELAEHGGVSATRNRCLDLAEAEYVMFCDADDMFYNACGLWIIFNEIKAGFDSLTSIFVEETRAPETKEVVYINREMDSTFVHGKVHRLEYLKENKIRWNPKLTIHEDSYFNILCQNLSTNVKYCMAPFYLWKWRDDSVCRHDPKYILKTYGNLIDSNDELIKEFLKRGHMDKAAYHTAFMIFDAYYTMNKPEWINQENKQYRDLVEKRFADYYKTHKQMWLTMPIQDKMMLSNAVRSRCVAEGMMMEAVTIDDWLKMVEKKNGGRNNHKRA